MNRKFTIILTGLMIAMFGIATISEAQPMEKEELTAKQERIALIAAFTAGGDQQQLKTALNAGLDAGLTVNEIKEVLVQLYAYAGFPRSLNALNTFMAVMDERGKKGIKDEMGKEASPMPVGKSSLEFGTENQTRLVGQPVKGPLYDFAPVIDQFLKAHLFGDIFQRDVLTWQERELATVAALTNIEGVNAQLQSHMAICMRHGFTDAQMRTLISLIKAQVGEQEGDNAAAVLAKIIGEDQNVTSKQEITVTHTASLPPTNGSPQLFTGSVSIDTPFNAELPSRYRGANVVFEAGARTAWHSHPLGQLLIVTSGKGRVQRWGDPAQEIRQGDVVWIPPDLKHWHGAAPDSPMTHIAIVEEHDGMSTQWMEKVSDEQYNVEPQ